MNSYPLWQYAHILLFVYWLGADLGVFFASRYVARADLPLDERLRFLELLLKVDMAPRTALILMIPVGFTLATTLGLAPFAAGWLPAIWILCLGWLALAWYLFRLGRDPRGARWARLDQALRLLVIAGFLGTGLATFVTGGPLLTRWLAGKFVLFAGVVTLGLLLRIVIRDWIKGFGELRARTSQDAANALIHAAHRRAARLAVLLWLFVASIAFLGVVKPG
ncbi:MAG: hypothetical protein IT481_06830 [Gammaproteobacteria bacterium]|nr:hypothetical protein [Gammaproteobacteria bacterium]